MIRSASSGLCLEGGPDRKAVGMGKQTEANKPRLAKAG
jgi:hypothetical protein